MSRWAASTRALASTLGGLLSVLLLLAGGPVSAAALGELVLESALGERLAARIPVSGDSDSLRVSVGAVADYDRLGLAPPIFLDELTLERQAPGRLTLGSERPVTELVLDLVIVLGGPADRQLRHYTLLLDFPDAALQPGPEGVEPRDRAASRGEDPAGRGVSAGSQRYGPVRPGQTLNGIASELAATATRQTVDAIADALYALNPDAFQRGNRNRLLAGSRLALPDGLGEDSQRSAPAPELPVPEAAEPEPPVPSERLSLEAPPAADELVGALADWIDRGDRELAEQAQSVRRDLNFARSEISTYGEQNRTLRRRVENLESRVASLRRVLALQEQLENRTRSAAGAVAAPAAASPPSSRAGEVVASTRPPPAPDPAPPGDAAAAAPAAAASVSERRMIPLGDTPGSGVGWEWFPYLGGLAVCILCGLLFYLRARAEQRTERQRRVRFREMQQEVRSYLPDEL